MCSILVYRVVSAALLAVKQFVVRSDRTGRTGLTPITLTTGIYERKNIPSAVLLYGTKGVIKSSKQSRHDKCIRGDGELDEQST